MENFKIGKLIKNITSVLVILVSIFMPYKTYADLGDKDYNRYFESGMDVDPAAHEIIPKSTIEIFLPLFHGLLLLIIVIALLIFSIRLAKHIMRRNLSMSLNTDTSMPTNSASNAYIKFIEMYSERLPKLYNLYLQEYEDFYSEEVFKLKYHIKYTPMLEIFLIKAGYLYPKSMEYSKLTNSSYSKRINSTLAKLRHKHDDTLSFATAEDRESYSASLQTTLKSLSDTCYYEQLKNFNESEITQILNMVQAEEPSIITVKKDYTLTHTIDNIEPGVHSVTVDTSLIVNNELLHARFMSRGMEKFIDESLNHLTIVSERKESTGSTATVKLSSPLAAYMLIHRLNNLIETFLTKESENITSYIEAGVKREVRESMKSQRTY